MGYREKHAIPDLGVGVGLRSPHLAQVLGARPPMDWFEIISENYFADGGIQVVRISKRCARASYRLVPHGVSLSIGGTDPIDPDYLARLKALTRRILAPWCSDHLCWTGVGSRRRLRVHDLLRAAVHARTAGARRRTRAKSAGRAAAALRPRERFVVAWRSCGQHDERRRASSSRSSRSAPIVACSST